MISQRKWLSGLLLSATAWAGTAGLLYAAGLANVSTLAFLGGANAYSVGWTILFLRYKPVRLAINFPILIVSIFANTTSAVLLSYQSIIGGLGAPFFLPGIDLDWGGCITCQP